MLEHILTLFLPGSMRRSFVISTILFEGERAEQLDALADRPRRLNGSMLLWVDLHDPSQDDRRRGREGVRSRRRERRAAP